MKYLRDFTLNGPENERILFAKKIHRVSLYLTYTQQGYFCFLKILSAGGLVTKKIFHFFLHQGLIYEEPHTTIRMTPSDGKMANLT